MTKTFNHPRFDKLDSFIEYVADGQEFDTLYPLEYSLFNARELFSTLTMEEHEVIISDEKLFVDTMPIVSETVSTKKHQYSIKQHVIYWMENGDPYILTPEPTIYYTRVGNELRQFKRGDHLYIPSMMKRVDLLTIVKGCKTHGKENTRYTTIYVKRYKRV